MFNGSTQEIFDGPKESQKRLNATELHDAFKDILSPFVVLGWTRAAFRVCLGFWSLSLLERSANHPVLVAVAVWT